MPSAPRCVALVGPYLSGKTTLLEAMLFASGTTGRRGTVRDGNSVGDHAAEARARQMSTEINVANATFLGDPWTFLDCPGSVELLLRGAAGDAGRRCRGRGVRARGRARDDGRRRCCKFLDDHNIPHMVFINKLDTANARVRDVLAALQGVSERPLVLRQVPLRGGENPRSPAMSIWSASAPIATSRARPPTWSSCPRGSGTQERPDPHRPRRKARRFRRQAAGAAARGRAALEGGDLPAT